MTFDYYDPQLLLYMLTAFSSLEFVFQSFVKSKENTEEMVTNTLKYHDNIAAKRFIEEVRLKLEMLLTTSGLGREEAQHRARLQRWRIDIDMTAVEEKANILKPPLIKFKHGPARINNGGFNLNRVQFSR